MKLNVNYLDDEKKLKAYNINESAIEFYNDQQHSVVPLSKVSGHQVKKMLKDWPPKMTDWDVFVSSLHVALGLTNEQKMQLANTILEALKSKIDSGEYGYKEIVIGTS